MSVRTVRGPRVLDDLGPALDDLLAAVRAPITARRPWLDTWIESYPDHEPWAVVVADGDRLAAAALLARRSAGRRTEVVALGNGPSDMVRLPARDDAAARALGQAVAAELRRISGPWRLRLVQLPAGDAVARAAASALSRARIVAADVSPTVRFLEDRTVRAHTSRNYRQNVSTGYNRLRRKGHTAVIERVSDSEGVARLQPEVREAHRARDLSLMRVSDLDDRSFARFWRRVALALAERGEAEITVLRVDGRVAAYLLGLLDGPAYRVWTSRFHPEWAWFNPGLLAGTAALERALEDPRFQEFDWMRGDDPYKFMTANIVVPAESLLAWSSGAQELRDQAPRRLQEGLKAYRDRHEALGKAWRAVKARTVLRGERPRKPGSP